MYESTARYTVRSTGTADNRVLVIGDIHGEYEMFQRLLRKAGYNQRKDFVFALGDLVDRGPNSREVLDWFACEDRRISLLGNHEAMMAAAAYDLRTSVIWRNNGGRWADGLEDPTAFLYRCMVRQMPLTGEIVYDSGLRVGLIHAEVRPGLTWARMKHMRSGLSDALDDWMPGDTASAIWGRSRFVADALLRREDLSELSAERKVWTWRRAQPVKGVDLVICGHCVTPDRLPRGRGNVLWIDTGSGKRGVGGRLTAVDPATRTYWQVGNTESESWGPLPLPDFEPVPRSLRPTPEEFKAAEKYEAAARAERVAALEKGG